MKKTHCPHCENTAKVVKTQQVNRMTREVTFRCDNIECGFSFVAAVEAIRQITPSAMPHPSVVLPMSARVKNRTVQVI